ncbi:MAG: hypothetical protein MPW15_25285 [Candidatus Manganitrophus sp.]|nr:hypothetical protein [Candidatus Manganitrophus sp.]
MSSRCNPQAGPRGHRTPTDSPFSSSFFFSFYPIPFMPGARRGIGSSPRWRSAYLGEQARKEIRVLIGEASLASVADWADRVRGDRPETAPWHFVDIPFKASRYDPKRDCADGECVIGAIERFRRILSDRDRPAEERAEALKISRPLRRRSPPAAPHGRSGRPRRERCAGDLFRRENLSFHVRGRGTSTRFGMGV